MNGYISIQVSGKPVGLKFAYPAVKWFLEAATTRADVFFVEGDAGSMVTDYGMAKLIHCAYRNNCLIKETEPVLAFEDFINFVEEETEKTDSTVLADIYTCYAESSISKKIVADTEKKSKAPLTLK